MIITMILMITMRWCDDHDACNDHDASGDHRAACDDHNAFGDHDAFDMDGLGGSPGGPLRIPWGPWAPWGPLGPWESLSGPKIKINIKIKNSFEMFEAMLRPSPSDCKMCLIFF